MQLAKLLKPKLSERTIVSKLKQMAYAIKIDYQYSKREILEAYLTLAPYGSNIEGIKAGTNAWLQRSPGFLTPSEAAFFVSLPQSPEKRRPDRNPVIAHEAKNKVLRRVAKKIGISNEILIELESEKLKFNRLRLSSHAPHLYNKFLNEGTVTQDLHTTINYEYQIIVQRILKSTIKKYPSPINTAALIVERKSGNVVSYVGSSQYLNKERKGAINYLKSIRSSGSTLKPFIYGDALNRDIIESSHIFNDTTFQKSGYAPTNFDGSYMGKITLKDALIRSRNIPAIFTLNLLGFQNFESRLKTLLGSREQLSNVSGLSLAVGGLYLTPEELAKLYVMLGNDGRPIDLSFTKNDKSKTYEEFFSKNSANKVIALLAQDQSNGTPLVLKTGTSHLRQDAWAAMITQKHVIIVWLGTPDNEPTKSLVGADTAMPLAIQISHALGFNSPSIDLAVLKSNHSKVELKSCNKLINFPEDGSWIISKNLNIAVSGVNHNQNWYLDGKPSPLVNNSMLFKSAGFHKISTEFEDCRQTVSIFIKQN